MPIQSHPSFSEPKPDDRLWRYMEFAKFVSLLTSKGLWFCNANVLAKEDPFEGSLPKTIVRNWTKADISPDQLQQFREGNIDPEKQELAIANYLQMLNRLPEIVMGMRNSFLISCWHAAPHETAAMWKSYGKHDGGIAITSSLSKLREALKKVDEPLYCGQIQYIDFDNDYFTLDNLFNPILRKRKSFQSENEVRLVYSDIAILQNPKGTQLDGRLFACDLQDLIEEVWIAPTSPPWFVGVIEEVCRLTNFPGRIRRSTLLDPPHQLIRPAQVNAAQAVMEAARALPRDEGIPADKPVPIE